MILSLQARLAIWLVLGFIAVPTMFLNLFIMLTSLHNYRYNSQWTPSDTIIMSLSLANSAYLLISYSWATFEEIDSKCYLNRDIDPILLSTVFSLKCTIVWTTAFLAFFYSTKLVIEPIQCYTKIQEVFLKHVNTVVLVIPMFGFCCCMPAIAVLNNFNTTASELSCHSTAVTNNAWAIYVSCYLLMSDIAPCLLIMKSSISITVHLAIHRRNMKASNNGFHAPKLSTEMRVIRMILSLVAVFFCFLVLDLFTHYTNVVFGENNMGIITLVTCIYIAISTLVLIYGRKSFWKALHQQYNLFLDEFPCLACLKVPDTKTKVKPSPGH